MGPVGFGKVEIEDDNVRESDSRRKPTKYAYKCVRVGKG